MSVRVHPPAGVVATQQRPWSLEEVPGARIVFHGEWLGPQVRLVVACGTRPIPLWVDGLGAAVLGGMNGMVRRHLDLRVVRPGEPELHADVLRQTFTGEGASVRVEGAHSVGFVDAGTLLACTALCEGERSAPCDTALQELKLEAGFVARAPTRAEQLLTVALQHPRQTVGIGLAVLFVLAVGLLVRRPCEAAL